MNAVFKAAWEAMEKYSKQVDKIKIIKDKENVFIEKCMKLYNNFSDEYMSKDNTELDRHKIGAIISIVGSSDNYIESNILIKKDMFFLGRYSIPVVVAFDFIEQQMNDDLHQFRLIRKNKTAKLYIPSPSSCETWYIDSIARILLHEEKKNVSDTLRVVELANTLFLIEECTLLKYKINMKKWLDLKNDE